MKHPHGQKTKPCFSALRICSFFHRKYDLIGDVRNSPILVTDSFFHNARIVINSATICNSPKVHDNVSNEVSIKNIVYRRSLDITNRSLCFA